MAAKERPEAPRRTRDYGLFLLSFLAVLFYALCATPSIGWRDGPELATTALYLDIAHPAGFPTYNLLAKIATWLPLGSLGFRVTLFSAVAGGAALLVLGLLIKKLHRLGDDSPHSGGLAWAWAALPFLALHQGIWAASVEVEVYSLNLALIAGLLYCAAAWHGGGGIRWLYAGGLLYGLACGNHAALALYLPVLLLLAVWGAPNRGPGAGPAHDLGRRLGLLAIFFLVGVSVYLLLYVRSNLSYLPINFGHPNNWERFWYQVSDAKDSHVHLSGLLKIGQLLFFLGRHFQALTSGLFWPGLPLAVWGLVHLWRRYQILAVALIVLILINMGFFFYWIDGISAFLPSVLAWFLLVSLGLGRLGRALANAGLPKTVVVGAAVLACLAGTAMIGRERWAERETKAGYMAVELFWPDLSELPPGAVNIQWTHWFPVVALQSVYRTRPDVTLLPWDLLLAPDMVQPTTPANAPTAAFPLLVDGSLMPQIDPLFRSRFLEANLAAGNEVLIQFSDGPLQLLDYLRPDPRFIFLASLQSDPGTMSSSLQNGDYDRYLARLGDFITKLEPLPGKAPIFIYDAFRPLAGLFEGEGRLDVAKETMDRFIDRFSDQQGRLVLPMDAAANAQHFQASILFKMGRYPEATAALERLVELNPGIAFAHFLLGLSLGKEGRHERAMESVRRAVDMEPENTSMAVKYSTMLAMRGSVAGGVDFLRQRSDQLRSKGLVNAAAVLADFSQCLALPPEIASLPDWPQIRVRGASTGPPASSPEQSPPDAQPDAPPAPAPDPSPDPEDEP